MNTRNLICFIVLLYTQSMVAQICPSLTYNGKTYQTVQIGTQCWMAENLNDSGHTAGVSSTYDQNNTNLTNAEKQCIADKFGRLYDWAAAKDIDSKIEGWHLPSYAEWTTLNNYLGGGSVARDKMKVGGSSGFNVLFAGYQDKSTDVNSYHEIGSSGIFWSAFTDENGQDDKYHVCNEDSTYDSSIKCTLMILNSAGDATNYRHSVRLVKD